MLLFLRLSICVQRRLKLEEFRRIEAEEQIMKQTKQRALERQRAQKAAELKVKMKAFACRKCSCKFSSNFKLHLHIQAKHTKKSVSSFISFTDIFTVTLSIISIISIIFDIIFNIFFSISFIFFIVSSTSSSILIFSPFTSIEISSSASSILSSTLTISYADVIKSASSPLLKLSSKSPFKSPFKSPVKSYLIWHDLTVMFREKKSFFHHSNQSVSSLSAKSSSTSSNTPLQSTIASNTISVSAFSADLIYENNQSNITQILSFLRVTATIFQSQIQIIWHQQFQHRFHRFIHLFDSILDEDNLSNHIKLRSVSSALIWIRYADLQIRWWSTREIQQAWATKSETKQSVQNEAIQAEHLVVVVVSEYA